MDEMLLLLLKKGANSNPVRITTTELGNSIGMSQQNASNRLNKLISSGHVERKPAGLILTKKAMDDLHETYSNLKSTFEQKPIVLKGKIVSGLGEGKYYLSFSEYTSQIKEKIGFVPYAGTLNLILYEENKAKKSAFIKSAEPIIISGFKKSGRTFGDLFIYPCAIGKIECALLIPVRTHHPSEIIEIISYFNLKEKLGKKDGDAISITL